MKTVVSSWQHNGYIYTLSAEPIATAETKQLLTESNSTASEFLSIFEYFGGKTPPYKTGEQVYKAAISEGVVIKSKEVSTASYTGKVMLYERSFLDKYFENTTTLPYIVPVAKPNTIPYVTDSNVDDDDLPF